jgi:hypothetical protein
VSGQFEEGVVERVACSVIVVLVIAVVAGCGSSGSGRDPLQQVPETNGVRAAIASGQHPRARGFPKAEGSTLEELARGMTGGPQVAMASSVVTVGGNRLAFGMIDRDGRPVYGPTAVYVAPTPGAPAKGPYVAPTDVLLTEKRYRSKQAATEEDPFAAVYAGQVPFPKAGRWSLLVATKRGDALVGASATVNVVAKSADAIPRVGERAPVVHTDTLESAKGDISRIETRVPPVRDMHTDFADAVGKKPVALLFSTPQLCQSRVCGPVTDIALQLQAKYGDRMTFIHEEVYADNDVQKGLREPLKQFNLQTEPWLFIVDTRGIITARMEGSIGLRAFESAIKTGI